MKKFDADYQNWRKQRRQKFSDEFDKSSGAAPWQNKDQTQSTNKK
jgi:hypothetical protein